MYLYIYIHICMYEYINICSGDLNTSACFKAICSSLEASTDLHVYDDDDVYLDRITQHKPKIIFHM
jgi:hypothetical protein